MLLVIQNQPADGHPRRVFVSYSHHDEPWKQRVVKALKPLEQQQRIAVWHDRKLFPGQDWDEEIRHALNRADVILFLVSPDFIESRYCTQVEGQLAVERADAGDAVLMPIIVRRCQFENEPFARYQAYPIDGSPLEEAPDEEARLADLREKIHLALLGWWYPRRPRGKDGTQALWQLQFRQHFGGASPTDEQLVRRLRELAEETDIVSCGRAREQSVAWKLESIAPVLLLNGPPAAFAKLDELHRAGRLSAELGIEVVGFRLVLGAAMQVATEVSEAPPPLLEEKESLVLTPSVHETPDLPQLLIVRDEQPHWMLLLPARGGAATPRSLFEDAQARFTRYLGTILAVPEGRLTVNLSTYEPENTLPESLTRTELGHDLMEQDCLLKQYAASLLHPDNPIGLTYWDALMAKAREIAGSDRIPLRAYHKAWVVPGKASVNEKLPEQRFTFTMPERFGVRETDRACAVESCTLDVLCEADYLAINHERASDSVPAEDGLLTQMSDASAALFRKLVLPAIKTEVNEGTHFAKLRQIYQAFVLAAWFRRELGKLPAFAPAFQVVNKGFPEAFGVQRSDEWTRNNKAVYERYLALFREGVFRCARTVENPFAGTNQTRIYFSGGMDLRL